MNDRMVKRLSAFNLSTADELETMSSRVFRLLLSPRRAMAKVEQQKLRSRIRRELKRQPQNVRLWCLLGDHYSRDAARAKCYAEAAKAGPTDAEANAELAYIKAMGGHRKQFEKHFDRALANAHRSVIEEIIIHKSMEAAKAAGDDRRQLRARRRGQQRYPGSSLFLD